MTDDRSLAGLRAARVARGWSQTDAARELVAMARSRGAPVAAAASLKTLLSRWENGHTTPDPQYRALLAELYGRSAGELGFGEPEGSAERDTALVAALAEAAAAHAGGPALWREQLELVHRLDDELGAAGAGELTGSLADRLAEILVHTVPRSGRIEVAGLLTEAATLAGTQCLDRADHGRAWRRFDQARTAAWEADAGSARAVAIAGQAAVLVDVGEHARAVQLLEQAAPLPDDAGQARLDVARALAMAAAGESTASRQAMADAERRLQPARPDVVDRVGRPPVELADLHRWQGRVLVELGDAAAEAPLRQALAADPRSTRNRAAVHADLALTLHHRDPREAERHARTAQQLAAGIGSQQIPARLAALGRPR